MNWRQPENWLGCLAAEAACRLRALRREIMQSNGWSLRDLYRTLETPGANRLRVAHAALDPPSAPPTA